jgi:hypothetical protein
VTVRADTDAGTGTGTGTEPGSEAGSETGAGGGPEPDLLARVRGSLARPTPATAALWAAILLAQLVALVAYASLPGVTLVRPRYALYGLVWVNVGLLVLVRVRAGPSSSRVRRRAAAVAAGYLVALAVAGGVVGPAGPVATGLSVAPLPPGWGPALVYSGERVSVVAMPARVVGYLALARLVYATVVDASGAGVAGLLGLLSCVSCTWPILASLVAGVAGGGSALAAATLGLSYDLSTAVFLVTVALLYWRPGWG